MSEEGTTTRPPERFQRRARPKLTDEIIESLRHDIAAGVLARGERLPNERELARQFGVSQPTIREVVRVLDTMGLIDVRHGSGAYVTGDGREFLARSLDTLLQLERVGIVDVLEVRGALGLYTAQRAVENATEAEIEEIEQIADALEHVGEERSIHRIAERVVAFQVALSAAGHNPLQYAIESFLIGLMMKFQLTAKSKSGIRFWRAWTLKVATDRRNLVEALRARDTEAAVQAMTTYLHDQRVLYSSDKDLSRLRLSDPGSVKAIAGIMFDIPDFANPQAGASSAAQRVKSENEVQA
jgi:GntR family transcriptional repressor for pyruvate dehydrogenase complex